METFVRAEAMQMQHLVLCLLGCEDLPYNMFDHMSTQSW